MTRGRKFEGVTCLCWTMVASAGSVGGVGMCTHCSESVWVG